MGSLRTVRGRTMVVGALVCAAVTACTDVRDVGVDNLPATTLPTASSSLAARLQRVNTDEIVMDAEFNEELVRLTLSAVGLSSDEAACAAEAIGAQVLGGLGGATVSALFGSATSNPAALMGCVAPERLAAIGAPVSTDQMDPELADGFRRLSIALSSAGFETLGLTAKEASCLSTVATAAGPETGGEAVAPTSPLEVLLDIDARNVEACISPERQMQLLG